MWEGKRKFKAGALLFVILLLMSYSGKCQNREYLIKSAFIEKITRFIEWPVDTTEKSDNIIFGILTKDSEMIETFEFYFEDQLIQDRKVIVKLYDESNSISDYDIIYISRKRRVNLERMWIPQLIQKGVLIIGDDCNEVEDLFHINLKKKGNNLSFEINPRVLELDDFYVSSRLYAYGKVIK